MCLTVSLHKTVFKAETFPHRHIPMNYFPSFSPPPPPHLFPQPCAVNMTTLHSNSRPNFLLSPSSPPPNPPTFLCPDLRCVIKAQVLLQFHNQSSHKNSHTHLAHLWVSHPRYSTQASLHHFQLSLTVPCRNWIIIPTWLKEACQQE